MQILGIDFTSSPSRRKPITALHCTFENGTMVAGNLENWCDFPTFEKALECPGPWIAGVDFPIGQSRRFIETIGWPTTWPDYVRHAERLGQAGFCEELNAYRSNRPAGDKEHRREADKAAGSISPQKLFGVPVGLMFFEGAPRLLRAGVTIPKLNPGDPNRIVVETYPGVTARKFVGRRSYKNDSKKKQTNDQYEARLAIFRALISESQDYFGFQIRASDSLCDDPSGDQLDALICAAQAAWAWQLRHKGFGAPAATDPLEGWIADPSLII